MKRFTDTSSEAEAVLREVCRWMQMQGMFGPVIQDLLARVREESAS
jgi:hypothetical protein